MTIDPLDFKDLNTYSVHDRFSKVTVENFARPLQKGATVKEFLASLPDQLLGREFPELISRLAESYNHDKPILVGMGGHVIKVGLNPLLIDLMEKGVITGIAMNGSCIVHDTEIAMVGRTSEDVDLVLGAGQFGAAKETGEVINEAINRGARAGTGMGEALGAYLLERNFPHNNCSLLASARRLGIPATVHVAVGTDIVHIHPSADGAAIGQTSYHDFKLFCRQVSELEGGAYLNFGSAVLMPEVFLKAITVVRNLGYKVERFTTANFDFIRQYRTMTNVVNRPTATGGRGFNVLGHHELMIPLLIAGLLERIDN
ncbi:MAG: hypothetical protein KKG47_08325 [Proteobacteria bacterium]|nr:hypothetical protein [Pseudomonadota bacterium]MBU1739341.1 hypothetical protein [Pseudomonadota bacterium]